MVKKLIFKLLFLYMFCISFCMFFTFTSHAKENIVVVIDPGHGGENLGTDYLPVPEKSENGTFSGYDYDAGRGFRR